MPIQYLNDSVYYIREAMQDLLVHNQKLQTALSAQSEPDDAAHAIGDAVKGTGNRGVITVRTRMARTP